MKFPAIKAIVFIFCFVFTHSVFAVSGYCDTTWYHTHESIRVTENDGITTTSKHISLHAGSHPLGDSDVPYKRIITIHDSAGSLLFSKHYTWERRRLVQTIDDGVVRNIISGKTPCDFTVVEPSGDSISFHLDPEKDSENILFQNDLEIIFFMYGQNITFPNLGNFPEYSALDAIMYYWYHSCKRYHEELKAAGLNMKLNTSIKEDGNSHALLYKYYVMLVISIIIVSIVIIHKKRKMGKQME
ncbi:MAG: hypothetical protein LBU89_09295 [Fibromonadaceae bacterium]|jgi:hypothetical protein|nr:hypothetical protein [Fibromonadaceae bacterium]